MPRLLFSLLFLPLFAPPAQAHITRLCNLEIEAQEEVDFSAVEERWLCGDPETPAWKEIPIPQQIGFLKNFLQSKGYHDPEIREEGGIVRVNAGAPLKVEKFTVIGGPYEWNWAKRWDIKGKPLAPETLDEAEGWAKRELQQRGFPCPTVASLALVNEREIQLRVERGEGYRFGPIETVGAPDLNPALLERFTAFLPGQTFDIRLLELTSSRILQEDLYLSTYYDVICAENAPVRIVRRSVPALPRLFTVGAGFDTDQGPLARARFKWSRLTKSANSLEASVFGSFREQSFRSQYNYFFLKDLSSRLRMIPSFSLERLKKDSITVTTTFGNRLAYSWEFRDYQLYADAGPSLERVRTLVGTKTGQVDSLKLESKISATSHLFEYYLSNPRQGWTATVDTSSLFGGVLADQSIHRLRFQHQILWNLGRWEPPFLILGWRGSVGSFFFGQRSVIVPDISDSQRFYLGVDDNIRGFSPRELPATRPGFLTSLYQGFELRSGGWFPFGLQPFVFFDLAKGGRKPARLDRPIYYAPGFGIRWDSPIGTVRGSLARGFVANRNLDDPQPHLQPFFSFGREF